MTREPTIAEMRAVCQPAHVQVRAAAEHWVAHAYLRKLSPYLTRRLVAAGASADAVTWMMIGIGAAAAAVTAWPGVAGALLAALLVQLQMLLDCSDGEVARWRGTSSAAGIYLDRIGHYVAECGIALGLGLRVALNDSWSVVGHPAVAGGALLALLVALNKVENDLVHVARAQAGVPPVPDDAAIRVPHRSGIRAARQLAGRVPVHRAFHSVELSLLVVVAAVADVFAGGGRMTALLLAALLVTAVFTVGGHLVAVLASGRLR